MRNSKSILRIIGASDFKKDITVILYVENV